MGYEIVVEETETLRVKIVLDDDGGSMNPRTDRDGIVTGVVTLPSRDYADIDDPTGTLPDEWSRLTERYDRDDAVRIFQRYVGLCGGVSEYDSPHDGPAAVWYVLPEYLHAVGFGETAGLNYPMPTREEMAKMLDAERQEYRSWAEGDVWGVVVEERATWQRVGTDETRDDWEEVEAVWGYIGQEYAEEEARGQFLVYSHPDHTFTAVNGNMGVIDVRDGAGNLVAAAIPFEEAAKAYGNRGINPKPKRTHGVCDREEAMPDEEIVRTILRHFITAAAWADARAEDGESVDATIPAEDVQLDPETEERVLDMIRAFLAELSELGEDVDAQTARYRARQVVYADPEQAGHDLWLTMRHHGAGFWDRGHGAAGDLLTELAQRLGSEDAHVLVHTATAEQANAVLGSPSLRIPEITLQYPN